MSFIVFLAGLDSARFARQYSFCEVVFAAIKLAKIMDREKLESVGQNARWNRKFTLALVSIRLLRFGTTDNSS